MRSTPPTADRRTPPPRSSWTRPVAAGAALALGLGVAWTLGAVRARSASREPVAEASSAQRAPERSEALPPAPAAAQPGALAGAVLDGRGMPAAGAQLVAASLAAGDDLHVQASASADAAGRFTFAGLPAGPYRVTATSGGESAESGVLHVVAGGRADVTLRLAATGPALSGRVEEPGGAPVPGALVTAEPAEAQGPLAPATYQARSDAGGAYQLALHGGSYQVTVRADGYAPLSELVRLTADTVRHFRIAPGALLAGVVVERGTQAPLAGAEVQLRAVGSPESAQASTRSGPDGTFWIHDLAGGVYRLVARQGARTGASAAAIRLGPAQQLRDLRVEVAEAATVTGHVLAQGRGVEDAAVALVARSGPADEVRAARSGPDGLFRIEGVAAGEYLLLAQASGCLPASRPIDVGDGDAETTLELAPAAALRGRVIDEGGAPVAGAAVSGIAATADGAGAPPAAVSGPDGAFELEGARPGPVSLYARKDAQGSAGPVPAIAGGEPVTLTLRRGAYVAGRVRFGDGRPAAGTRVVATPLLAEGPTAAEGDTAPDGSFRLGPFPAGELSVAVSRPGQMYMAGVEAPDARTVTLADGLDRDGVELVAPASGHAIAGTVVDAGGNPVDLATVTAGLETAGAAGGADFQTMTDAAGHFTFDDLPGGTYHLWAAHPLQPGADRSGVPAGSQDVTLQLPAGAGLQGVAVNADGTPLTDFVLSAEPDQEADPARAALAAPGPGAARPVPVHHAQGRFALDDLPPGHLRVRVEATGGRRGELRVALRPGERRTDARIAVAPEDDRPKGN